MKYLVVVVFDRALCSSFTAKPVKGVQSRMYQVFLNVVAQEYIFEGFEQAVTIKAVISRGKTSPDTELIVST